MISVSVIKQYFSKQYAKSINYISLKLKVVHISAEYKLYVFSVVKWYKLNDLSTVR